VLYGEPPDLDSLRVIGCLCYAVVTKPHKDKFENRGIKCVLLGYPPNQKGYKLYNWETKEVFLSRDVIFEELVFPFNTTLDSTQQILPSSFPMFGDSDMDEEPLVSNLTQYKLYQHLSLTYS
jgi:hypothetical protein